MASGSKPGSTPHLLLPAPSQLPGSCRAQLPLAGAAVAEQNILGCGALAWGPWLSPTAPAVHFPMGNDVLHRLSEARLLFSNGNVHPTEHDLVFGE